MHEKNNLINVEPNKETNSFNEPNKYRITFILIFIIIIQRPCPTLPKIN